MYEAVKLTASTCIQFLVFGLPTFAFVKFAAHSSLRCFECLNMTVRGPPSLPPLDEGCEGVTAERKYYHRGNASIKRSLRPREYLTNYRGNLHIPRVNKERLQNEAASLRFIHKNTNIPVPAVLCDFEDDGAYYLITEFIEGECMAELSEEQKVVVGRELEEHLATLRTLKSDTMGGPSGIVIPPYRVTRVTENDDWVLRTAETKEYVFCHNDLSQANVIVDPKTLKITGIIDWEYAGFFPEWFEWRFYTRKGPSDAIGDEKTDSHELLTFLESHQIQVGFEARFPR